MNTSESKIKRCDSKPVGTYSTIEIIKLEQIWRLKLKKSGFSDYEMWDNRPRKKKKTIRFIKSHIRVQRYGSMDNYYRYMHQVQNYFRIIGLYAHHCPKGQMPEKYRALLQDYVNHGYRSQSIRNVAPEIKNSAIEMYLMKNLSKMIEFVSQLDQEDDDEGEADDRQLTGYN